MRRRPAGASEEPIYGAHYLPRKFKTVVAVPPHNDVDVFAQDLAFIAIVENGTGSSATTSRSAAAWA